jgi:hyaluronan synthase
MRKKKPRINFDTVTPRRVTIRTYYPIVGLVVMISLVFLGIHHWEQLGVASWRIPVISLSFLWMCTTLIAAHFNRPAKGLASTLRVGLVIPSHNEDPAMLQEMLASIDAQTILPHVVYFIENGGTNGDAERIFKAWAAETLVPRPIFMYRQQAGKRDAQVAALVREFRRSNMVDVIVTVDGDTELDPRAIFEGLKPFADPTVMSVAGLLVGKNRVDNLLTRIVDLGFVSSFMNGRAAWSAFGSVAVNCGGLAFYRSWVIKAHLKEYVEQTLFGRKLHSGDDRMLTAFAALEGRTVFQETSVGYTLLPSNFSHLTRQRGRWWRSFWWGGIWLIRRFEPTRIIWWLVASQYITFVLYAVLFPLVVLYDPLRHHTIPWAFFIYAFGLSYLRSARTLAVNRPDQTLRDQLTHFLILSPLVVLLNLWLCTTLQWWGLFTFYETGWRTRQKVEVGIAPSTSSVS